MDATLNTNNPIQPPPRKRYNPNTLLEDERMLTTRSFDMLPAAEQSKLLEQVNLEYDVLAAEPQQSNRFSLAGIAENRKLGKLNRKAIALQAQKIAESRHPRIALRVARNMLGEAEGQLLVKYFNQYYYAASPTNIAKAGINAVARGIGGAVGKIGGAGGKGIAAGGGVFKRTAAQLHKDLLDPKKTTVVGRLYRPARKKKNQLQNFIFGRIIGGISKQISEIFAQVKQGIEVAGQAVRNSMVMKRILGGGRVLNTVVVKPAKGILGIGGRVVNAIYKTARATVGTVKTIATLGTGAIKGGLAGAALAIGLGGGAIPAAGALAGIGLTTAAAGALLESYIARSRMTLNEYLAAGIKHNLYHQVRARMTGDPLKYMEEIKAKRMEIWRHNNAGSIDPTDIGRKMQLERAADGIHIPKRITFARSVSKFLNWGAAGALLAPLLPALGISALGGALLLGGGAAALQVVGDTAANRLVKQIAGGQVGKLFSAIPLMSAIDLADAAVYKSLVLRQSINGGALSPLAKALGYDPSDPRFASLRLGELEQTIFDVKNPLGLALTYMNFIQYVGVSSQIRNFVARFALNRLVAGATSPNSLRFLRELRVELRAMGFLKGGPAMSFQMLRATALAPVRFVAGIFRPVQSIRNLINGLRALKGFPLVVGASFLGGAVGSVLGSILAVALGLPVGTFALIGGTVGGFIGGGIGMVAGGYLGMQLGASIGSAFGPVGTFLGGVAGAFFGAVGTFFGELTGNVIGTVAGGVIDKVTTVNLPQINIVNPLTIIQGAWNLVKFITSPLRNLTDYADLAMMLVSMITFFAALASINGGASTISTGSFSEPVAEYLNNKPILIAADQIEVSADGYSLNFNQSISGSVFISGLEVNKSSGGYTLSNEFLTVAVTAENIETESEQITASSLRLNGSKLQATATYDKIPTVLASSDGAVKVDSKVNFCEILPSLADLCKD